MKIRSKIKNRFTCLTGRGKNKWRKRYLKDSKTAI